MTQEFEITWTGDLPGSPEAVWDAITVHSGGWLWPVRYEPRAGGSATGLGQDGTVTVWDPPRHFATQSPDRGGVNVLDCVVTPAGLPAIDGVVDYVAPEFLGVRTEDALYRFYGRDAWGWPVGVAHHLFAPGADGDAAGRAWQSWLDDIYPTSTDTTEES